ncbi:MAG: WD40/YVTN/BNR-like repeat-containing protein, partial [bacterium]
MNKLTAFKIGSLFLFISFLILSPVLVAQNLEEHLFKEMKWRSIGPANFSGRIVDVEALDNDFAHVIVASASGGVWKSVNAGTTWEPIFDHYGSASIGDIAIFQPNPNIIWVGTGEANNRNSVAWGDGIYKSSDGGKTFQNMGLKDTYQIARIITHPVDSNIVYIAAIGNLWGYSGDRGLFKTTDGGKTWTKLTNGLPNDGKTGAIDLVMDPSDPNTLYGAFYQRLRKPYRFDSGGPNGGIFKTTDGGNTWAKLTNGLPTGDLGRIGLAIYRKNPKTLMAVIEHGFQPEMYETDHQNMMLLGT